MKSAMFDRYIFLKVLAPVLKAVRTESNILAPSQYLILHFVHGWDKKELNFLYNSKY